ncbi:MAG: DUF1328 domain-containing protein [Chitinispirillia bacterium]|nr:DUF1328 domain-containing protein [Chitinispirillia bacterium]
MLKLSLIFLILSISSAVVKYMTEPPVAESTNKIYDMATPLFFLFLALFVVSFLGGLLAKPPRIHPPTG